MAILISISNPDKGTGKSVAAFNLAFSLSLLERKTLLIEYDPDGDFLKRGGPGLNSGFDLFDLITGNTGAANLAGNYFNDNFFCIPASRDLTKCEDALSDTMIKEMVFDKVLSHYKNTFDYIILDTPSMHGFLTVSAFSASDMVITPVQNDKMVFEQLLETLTLIKYVRKKFNDRLRFGGTFFNKKSTVFQENSMLEKISDMFRDTMFKTVIPQSATIEKGAVDGKAAGAVNIMSDGATAFLELAYEIINKE